MKCYQYLFCLERRWKRYFNICCNSCVLDRSLRQAEIFNYVSVHMNGTLRGWVLQGASPKKAKQMGKDSITDATSQSVQHCLLDRQIRLVRDRRFYTPKSLELFSSLDCDNNYVTWVKFYYYPMSLCLNFPAWKYGQ